jgi:hypothetical protein
MSVPNWFYFPLAAAALVVVMVCWIRCVHEDRREKLETERHLEEVTRHAA